MIALARKLQPRGHEIVFIGVPDVGPYASAADLISSPTVKRSSPQDHAPALSLQWRSFMAPRRHAGPRGGQSNIELNELGPIPSNVIVVDKAPQLELLKSCVLCITHAGLNTALESLAEGVPMMAIPIGYNQFGVAIRIAYHGVGEFLEVDESTTSPSTVSMS
jgi:UDP:flavonoid glycosyltransferase YjiC (YdhE family)